MGPIRLIPLVLFGLSLPCAESALAQCDVVELVRPDGEAQELHGRTVAIGGGWCLVGAPDDDVFGPLSGSAYVYDAATGALVHKFVTPTGAPGERVGSSVAIAGDVGIVGAHGADAQGPGSGVVYVIDLPTGQVLATLSAADGDEFELFGNSVAVAGGRLLVGAVHGDGVVEESGAAYLFDLTTGQELFKVAASDGGASELFGAAVGVGATRLVVGSPWDWNASPYGSAYVYDLATGQELYKLVPPTPQPNDQFGRNVACRGDLAVMGVPNRAPAGVAYVFDLVTGQVLHTLQAPDAESDDRFGAAVAIEGNRVLVTASNADEEGQNTGAAYLFDLETGASIAKLTLATADWEEFVGLSAAMADGRILLGAPRNDDQGEDSGTAYVFAPFASVGASYCGPAVPNSTGQPAQIAAAGCTSVDDDFLVLAASALPPKQFGYFLVSATQGFVAGPGGSQGNLCLAGDIGRYAKQAAGTGAAGELALEIDLGKLPTHPPRAVLPGETWSFQCWFRDKNPTSTSNFTDGVAVTFR